MDSPSAGRRPVKAGSAAQLPVSRSSASDSSGRWDVARGRTRRSMGGRCRPRQPRFRLIAPRQRPRRGPQQPCCPSRPLSKASVFVTSDSMWVTASRESSSRIRPTSSWSIARSHTRARYSRSSTTPRRVGAAYPGGLRGGERCRSELRRGVRRLRRRKHPGHVTANPGRGPARGTLGATGRSHDHLRPDVAGRPASRFPARNGRRSACGGGAGGQRPRTRRLSAFKPRRSAISPSPSFPAPSCTTERSTRGSTLPEGAYPGDEEIERIASDRCMAKFADYVGLDFERSRLSVYWSTHAQTWMRFSRIGSSSARSGSTASNSVAASTAPLAELRGAHSVKSELASARKIPIARPLVEGVDRTRSLAVTCVVLSVKALLASCSGPQALVKVERPQRSEDERP